ncbi:MAG: hypothetical protein JO317_03895 [Verrucomicrobiae bacterium]|nr:hypothetical protein [Verrucomicrobiae bacterium]
MAMRAFATPILTRALTLAVCAAAFSLPTHASDEATQPITINAPHEARVIEDGFTALENILQMIERANSSIEMESFKFTPDRSGRLVLQALAKKARAGVKVRILVDHFSQRGRPGLNEYYEGELARHGIELRHFNIVSMLMIWKAGFRDHRKLLIVDRRELCMGGRNLADEYFGLGTRINYVDREVWIRGPIAAVASDHFERYWNDAIVERMESPIEPSFGRLETVSSRPSTMRQDEDARRAVIRKIVAGINKARDVLTPGPSDVALRKRVSTTGAKLLAAYTPMTLHSVTFVSDSPVPGDEGRGVTPYFLKRLREARERVWIENYIFMVKGPQKELLLELLKRGVAVSVLTNSLISEPNFVMSELENSRQNMAVDNGATVYCYSAVPTDDQIDLGKDILWTDHTKCMVIDGKDSMVGSYNLDPRSARINCEDAIFVNDSPEFAAVLERSMKGRTDHAYRMAPDGSYTNGPHVVTFGRVMTILLRPLVELFTDQL